MLGLEVARQLSINGVDVITAGRSPDSDIITDLGSGDPPILRRQHRADILFHCAAAFGGDSFEGRSHNLRVNVDGCSQVLHIAKESGIRKLIYAGSVSSGEGFLSDPSGGYGFTKALAEKILSWGIRASGGEFRSLRFGQLWDTEGLCCKHQLWFGRIIAYASSGRLLRLPPADGPRNFLHVTDAARFLIKSASTDAEEIYSVCHPRDIDLYELAEAAYRIFGSGGRVEIDPTKAPFRRVQFPRDSSFFEKVADYPRIELPLGLELIKNAGTAGHFGPIDVE